MTTQPVRQANALGRHSPKPTIPKLLSTPAVVGQFDDSHYSFKRTSRRLFGHIEENIEPLLAGKFAVKFAVRLFGFGKVTEFGSFLLHGRIMALSTAAEAKILLLFQFAL
jgi:hypothetical protein